MGKGIYTYYKERLIEIGGNNKCLYLKSIVRKGAYDLGKIFEGRDEKVAEFVEFLRSGRKYPLTIIGSGEKKEILQNLADTAHYVKTRHYFPERKGFTHRPCPWRLQSTAVGGVGANALRNVLLIDAVLTGNKESEEISRSTIMQMLKYRELYHSPQKNNHPDHPTAKNAGAIIYFMPLMMELMEQLNWELPETMEYAPIRKNNGILPKE